MVRNKVEFKCDCGHMENEHNWDPWSSFFGICEHRQIVYLSNFDGSYEADEEHCPCNRFRVDNLRFLEELSAKNIHRRSKSRSETI